VAKPLQVKEKAAFINFGTCDIITLVLPRIPPELALLFPYFWFPVKFANSNTGRSFDYFPEILTFPAECQPHSFPFDRVPQMLSFTEPHYGDLL